MIGNRALEAIKRLLTADTYIRSHDRSAHRGTSTLNPEHNPESGSAASDPDVAPRPEVG